MHARGSSPRSAVAHRDEGRLPTAALPEQGPTGVSPVVPPGYPVAYAPPTPSAGVLASVSPNAPVPETRRFLQRVAEPGYEMAQSQSGGNSFAQVCEMLKV
jgi:hypothetical protein